MEFSRLAFVALLLASFAGCSDDVASETRHGPDAAAAGVGGAGGSGGGEKSEADAAKPPDGGVERCADGLPRGTPSAQHLILALNPSAEGVTVCPNGDVFVSRTTDGQILRVPLDGSAPEVWTTHARRQWAGIACDAKGVLFAADFGMDAPTAVRIATKDDPGTPLPAIDNGPSYQGLNGIVAVDGLGIYASDTNVGMIVRFAEIPGGTFEASLAADNLPKANGLAYDPSSRKLYVALTWLAQIVSFEVAQDGSLGARKDEWTGFGPDGVAVDESGDLYAANYLGGYVARLADDAKIATLTGPASLAFRGGTLLMTEYNNRGAAPGALHAVDLGVCGAR
jgi:sugar lactone lactonase YvrE